MALQGLFFGEFENPREDGRDKARPSHGLFMKKLLAWGWVAAGLMAVAQAEERGSADVRRGVFAHCQRVEWRFDGAGRPVEVDAMSAVGSGAGAVAFDPDEWAAACAAEGDGERKAAVLAWLAEEREVPGETVLAAGAEAGGVYVLSERGEASRCLKRYDAATGRVERLSPEGRDGELVGPLFLPDRDGGMRLAGLQWRSAEGVRTEWSDPAMAAAARRLEAAWPGTGFDWMECAGEFPGRWIVRARSAERPPVWLEVDAGAEAGGMRVLAECPVAVSPTVRRVVRWKASDGAVLEGIFTRSAMEGTCPLAVFPHGGPGALSTADFDERTWALADSGFAVFQPNYRGSAGYGKAFRFAGWRAEGIRRAMLDIREGVAAVEGDPELGVAEGKAVLLGGSWGGYCVLEQLAMFPEAYSGGAAFFGVYDLPALVGSETERIAASGGDAAEKARELLGLHRQFADPADAAAMAELAAISPIRHLEGIRAPVLLFHKRGDATVPFAQSECLYGEMTRRKMPVEFIAADGAHGFAPEEEADLYGALAEWFCSRGFGDEGEVPWTATSDHGGIGRLGPDGLSIHPPHPAAGPIHGRTWR